MRKNHEYNRAHVDKPISVKMLIRNNVNLAEPKENRLMIIPVIPKKEGNIQSALLSKQEYFLIPV